MTVGYYQHTRRKKDRRRRAGSHKARCCGVKRRYARPVTSSDVDVLVCRIGEHQGTMELEMGRRDGGRETALFTARPTPN